MAFKILEKGIGLRPVYIGDCTYCRCVFEFNKEDVESEFFDQKEGYNVLYLTCPHCKSKIGVEEKIIRRENK